MSDPIITVENLSKRYLIGHQRVKGEGLRHAIEKAVRSPFQWLNTRKNARAEEREDFWALKDVSFELNQGDVVGIIGSNGAGKSTLLKILSRITEPTAGRIRLKGRVASLLEVGTGFHPELTGRENIFLNGAILGMAKVEIRRKFDEIVAFSEVEKFLDTPVKHYSSGMYVRLAFAVAAHLEPEILIVDEVLAVGDAQFQQKCLGKMKDVATGGRTILFVSHNMQAVSILCNRSLFLQRGSIAHAGEVKRAIDLYLASFTKPGGNEQSPDRRPGSGEYRFTSARPTRDYFGSAEEKAFNFEFRRYKKPVGRMWLSAHVVDSNGAIVIHCDSRLVGILVEDCDRAAGQFRFTSPWFKPGNYRLDLLICAGGIVDLWEGACSFTISPVLPYPNSLGEDGAKLGFVFGDFAWETDKSAKNTGFNPLSKSTPEPRNELPMSR
jgi:lipopolysaccharide transport system ATP-binding protein